MFRSALVLIPCAFALATGVASVRGAEPNNRLGPEMLAPPIRLADNDRDEHRAYERCEGLSGHEHQECMERAKRDRDAWERCEHKAGDAREECMEHANHNDAAEREHEEHEEHEHEEMQRR